MKDKTKTIGGLQTKGYIKKSSKNFPLVSIVTVVLNGEHLIERTIKSVVSQGYKNFEYIIIDGNSSDSTLEIVHKYEHAIDLWVSQNDSGIYDAMNSGLIHSRGEWCIFINAGDQLLNIPEEEITNTSANYYMILGQTLLSNGRIRNSNANLNHRHFNGGMAHCHQSIFYHKHIYKQLKYSTHYKFISDRIYTQICCKEYNFAISDTVISSYLLGGYTAQNVGAALRENISYNWKQGLPLYPVLLSGVKIFIVFLRTILIKR